MGFVNRPLYPPPPTHRKVFISYFRGDHLEVEAFVNWWGGMLNAFIPLIVGACGNDVINSQNADYVIGKIRREQIADSTVTMVLMGNCTHSRRHVDWEIKASLSQGEDRKPNGLLGIVLPSNGSGALLPPRFEVNWQAGNQGRYARYYIAPKSPDELRIWIEDAFWARTTRAHLIENRREMMGYNGKCQVCGVTHSRSDRILLPPH